ncbi:unnamed protein product [Polarella glacialis]|uniref:Pentatricopeptide repeat-containing protein, chloroplastic n=1 Tax=Polarella glacialis TaxID=89957 RepID=A0A813EU11_POLGL|nr:unnamed protein product [Polarella glacialis]CAE8664255.1 unnamed protein product [Polarella glacialis]
MTACAASPLVPRSAAPSLSHGQVGASLSRALAVRSKGAPAGTRDSRSLASAIAGCKAGARWPDALHMLAQACAAHKQRELELDAAVFNSAAAVCSQASCWRHALFLLGVLMPSEHGIEPDAFSCSAAMNAWSEGDHWPSALALLTQPSAPPLQPSLVLFGVAQRACARAGCWVLAFELLAAARHSGLKPDEVAFTAAVGSAALRPLGGEEGILRGPGNSPTCSRGAPWQIAARLLLKEMRIQILRPNAISFGKVIAQCAGSFCWAAAISVLWCMVAMSVRANAIPFAAAIGSCEHDAQWRRALQLLHVMRGSRLQPDNVAQGSAANACEKALSNTFSEKAKEGSFGAFSSWAPSDPADGGPWGAALRLLWEMTSLKGLQADVVAASVAISSCGKGRQWERALSTMTLVRQLGVRPNVVFCTAALSSCERSSRWEEALLLLRGMQDSCIKPSVVSFSAAVNSCGKAGCWEAAFAMLQVMKCQGVQPGLVAHSAAISASEIGSLWSSALELRRNMNSERVAADLVASVAAIGVAAAAGLWQLALELLLELGSFRLRADTSAVNTVLSACREASCWTASLRLLAFQKETGVEVDGVSCAAAVLSCCVPPQSTDQNGDASGRLPWTRGLALWEALTAVGVSSTPLYCLSALLTESEQRDLSVEAELVDRLHSELTDLSASAEKRLEPGFVAGNAGQLLATTLARSSAAKLKTKVGTAMRMAAAATPMAVVNQRHRWQQCTSCRRWPPRVS